MAEGFDPRALHPTEREHFIEDNYGFEIIRGSDDQWYYRTVPGAYDQDHDPVGPFEHYSDAQAALEELLGWEDDGER